VVTDAAPLHSRAFGGRIHIDRVDCVEPLAAIGQAFLEELAHPVLVTSLRFAHRHSPFCTRCNPPSSLYRTLPPVSFSTA
jgi:hypothetical protein